MRRQRKWWSKSSGTCSEPIIRTLSSLLPALLDLQVAHFYYHCLCIRTSLRTFVWGFGLCDDVQRLKSQFPFCSICSLSFCHTPFQTSGCSTSFRMSATRALAASIPRCSQMCAKPSWPAANQIEQIHLESFHHWKVVFQKRCWRSSGLLSFHYNHYTWRVVNTHCIISQQRIYINIYHIYIYATYTYQCV